MHETAGELRDLQLLLDRSHAAGGQHLRGIFSEERRMSAEDLADLLTGVQVLDLATVSAAGHPLVAPVDGLFFHGRFYFGSSPDSVRFRHIRRNPNVSAAHTRGEELTVLVHGVAEIVDTSAAENAAFRDYLIAVYGASWWEWGAGASYARIEPRKMFAVRMH